MTWNYVIDGESMTVWDHSGTEVASLTTTSAYRIPDDVLDVMSTELDAAISNGDSQRAIKIGADAACEQIEEGQP